jgi:hypothetical protein
MSSLSEDERRYYVRSEVFTAVTVKNAVFWDVAPGGSSYNQSFGSTCHAHLRGGKNTRTGTQR